MPDQSSSPSSPPPQREDAPESVEKPGEVVSSVNPRNEVAIASSSLSSSSSVEASSPVRSERKLRRMKMEDLSGPSEIFYTLPKNKQSRLDGEEAAGHPWYKVTAKYLSLGLYQPGSRSPSTSSSDSEGGRPKKDRKEKQTTVTAAAVSAAVASTADVTPSDSSTTANTTSPDNTESSRPSSESDSSDDEGSAASPLEDELAPADPEAAVVSQSSAASPAAPPTTFRSNLQGNMGTLLCGFIAGCVSRTSTAPLDRVKILVQEGHNLHKMIQPKNPDPLVEAKSYRRLPRCETPTVREVLMFIYREDGVKGYFKGNGVNCFKAGLESGVVFTVRKRLSDLVEKRRQYEKTATVINPLTSLSSQLFFGRGTDSSLEPLIVTGCDLSPYGHNVPTPLLSPKMVSVFNKLVHEKEAADATIRLQEALAAAEGNMTDTAIVADAVTAVPSSNKRFMSAEFTERGAPGLSLLDGAKTIPKVPKLTATASHPLPALSSEPRLVHISQGDGVAKSVAAALASSPSSAGGGGGGVVFSIDTELLPHTARDDHYKLYYYKQLANVRLLAGGGEYHHHHHHHHGHHNNNGSSNANGEEDRRSGGRVRTIYFSVSSLPSLIPNFIVGSVSGATAQCLLYPLELIKTRIAVARKGEFNGGVRECITYTYRSGGIKEFYKGLAPNLAGIIPYRGLEVGIFFTVQGAALRRHKTHKDASHKHLSALETAGIGTLASVIAQTATYPLNVIRTRLQTQGVNNRPKIYNGMTDCFVHLMKNEGWPGLFRGLTANYLKAVPASAITFVVFEEMQKLIGE